MITPPKTLAEMVLRLFELVDPEYAYYSLRDEFGMMESEEVCQLARDMREQARRDLAFAQTEGQP
jgi:hypothetical protein